MKDATLRSKLAAVADIVAKIKNSQSTLIVNCVGLTVAETMNLRKELYANNCELRVVKNNIIRRAVNECGFADVDAVLHGPSALAFSPSVMAAPKVIYTFARKNEKLQIKAGIVEGKILPLDDLKVVAALPDKKGMISMLLSVLQAPIRNLSLVIKGIAEQRG